MAFSSSKNGTSINNSSKSNQSDISITQEKARWTSGIKQFGATKEYEKFKQEFSQKDFNTQHLASHLFGYVLYDTVGINGVTVCDSSFSFGCYHGFFTNAISTNGLSIVPKIEEACSNKFGQSHASPCRHGIGHGLVEYLGHASDKIPIALKACQAKTNEPGQTQFFGCYTGVFMEYFQQIIITGKTPTFLQKPLDPKHPYDICPNLDKVFRTPCYFQIVQWWQQVYNYDYQKIGYLCENIQNPDEKTACFEGAGNTIGPSTNFDYKLASQTCEKLNYHDGVVLCKGAAARTISAQPTLSDTATHTCDGLEGQDYLTCVNYTKI